MITSQNDVVTIGANGLVRVCSYCVPRARLDELHRAYPCTDGICERCCTALHDALDAKYAELDVLEVERVVEETARLRRVA